jgi:hypothetical protein
MSMDLLAMQRGLGNAVHNDRHGNGSLAFAARVPAWRVAEMRKNTPAPALRLAGQGELLSRIAASSAAAPGEVRADDRVAVGDLKAHELLFSDYDTHCHNLC